jgi:hypothetical protein
MSPICAIVDKTYQLNSSSDFGGGDMDPLRRATIRQQQRLDQHLAQFRRWYFGLSMEQRAKFQGWLELLAIAQEGCPVDDVQLILTLFAEPLDDDVAYDGPIDFDPATLLEALKGWNE